MWNGLSPGGQGRGPSQWAKRARARAIATTITIGGSQKVRPVGAARARPPRRGRGPTLAGATLAGAPIELRLIANALDERLAGVLGAPPPRHQLLMRFDQRGERLQALTAGGISLQRRQLVGEPMGNPR